MNVRYLIEGAPAAIAFFIGIYDVLDNFGLRAGEGAAVLATCPNNVCNVWGAIWLFRVMLFVLGPLLRDYEAAVLLARIQADLCTRFDLPEAQHALLMKVQACQRHAAAGVVTRHFRVI